MANATVIAANHVSFTVSDVARTVAYFQDVYGLQLLQVGPREPTAIRTITDVPDADIIVGFVQAPNIRIELVQYLEPQGRQTYRPRPCDLGFTHLAFDVTQLDAIVERAARHGALPVGDIAVIDRGPNIGARAVYLRDPDGITVELMEQRRKAAD